MVEQQQLRSPWLAALAALSLAEWLALFGLLWYSITYPGYPGYRYCGGDGLCGLELAGFFFLFGGTAAFLGFAAWLGATVRAVRRREVLSAFSSGLLLPVALINATRVGSYAADSLAFAGVWALYGVVSGTLLATSVTTRQTVRRLVAVAGLVLAVALLVASTLVNSYCVVAGSARRIARN